jgi:hypothetical protein|tara:strand:+ start:47 stop:187 length:141 start_codon:yes stop_codon:yes gene_type:complete
MITDKEYLEHLITTRNSFYNTNQIDLYDAVQIDIDKLILKQTNGNI